MRRAAIALVLVLGIVGCLADAVMPWTTATVTVEPGSHEVVNVSVPTEATEPHLCYTAEGNASFDALVYGDTEEYAAYRNGNASNPLTGLSGIDAHVPNYYPDVERGGEAEPTTHHIVVDNTDYGSIGGFRRGAPRPASEHPIAVTVRFAVRQGGCA